VPGTTPITPPPTGFAAFSRFMGLWGSTWLSSARFVGGFTWLPRRCRARPSPPLSKLRALPLSSSVAIPRWRPNLRYCYQLVQNGFPPLVPKNASHALRPDISTAPICLRGFRSIVSAAARLILGRPDPQSYWTWAPARLFVPQRHPPKVFFFLPVTWPKPTCFSVLSLAPFPAVLNSIRSPMGVFLLLPAIELFWTVLARFFNPLYLRQNPVALKRFPRTLRRPNVCFPNNEKFTRFQIGFFRRGHHEILCRTGFHHCTVSR